MALLVFRSTELHQLLERYPGKSIYNVMNPEMDGYWQFLGRVDLEGGWFFHSPVHDGTTRDNFDFKAFLHQVAGAEFDLDFDVAQAQFESTSDAARAFGGMLMGSLMAAAALMM